MSTMRRTEEAKAYLVAQVRRRRTKKKTAGAVASIARMTASPDEAPQAPQDEPALESFRRRMVRAVLPSFRRMQENTMLNEMAAAQGFEPGSAEAKAFIEQQRAGGGM